ncbi:PIN domain-like protein [Mycena latifolia]|nr:PIN domain-like protein [Mycena latifolia]
MGVPGLWERLKDAAEIHDILQLTVERGFENGRECQPILVGVDASIWMYQVDRAITYSNAQAGPNPQLRALFYRLATLLQLPIRVIFVFDGPARPQFKRNTRVVTDGHRLTTQFRELIQDFGYHSYTAPAEADAELGRLGSEGLVDVVETTDSDVLLFGAPTVFYTPRKKEDGNNVTVFTAENVFITPAVGLTRGGLLLIALLSGGDYHQQGIPGCGIVTAHAIARGSFGDKLLHEALQNPTPTAEFLDFLISWKEALQSEFSTNAHGLLGRRHPAIAAAIAQTPAFPDLDVIFAYVHPITSWSGNHLLPDYHSWGLAQPNLTRITAFCQRQFGWDADVIRRKFSKLLYLGIATQSLLKPYDLYALLEAHVGSGLSSDDDFPRSSVLRVLKSKTATSHYHTLKSYRVEMSAGALSLHVKAGLNDASAFPAPTLMINWIPAPIIDYALPDLVSRSKISAVKLNVSKSRLNLEGRSKISTRRSKVQTRAPPETPIAGPSRISSVYSLSTPSIHSL